MDKTNEADLSSDVLTILISFTCNYSIVINKQATGSTFGVIYLFLFGLCKSQCGPMINDKKLEEVNNFNAVNYSRNRRT